jgi:hypothetical protein
LISTFEFEDYKKGQRHRAEKLAADKPAAVPGTTLHPPAVLPERPASLEPKTSPAHPHVVLPERPTSLEHKPPPLTSLQPLQPASMGVPHPQVQQQQQQLTHGCRSPANLKHAC